MKVQAAFFYDKYIRHELARKVADCFVVNARTQRVPVIPMSMACGKLRVTGINAGSRSGIR